MNQIILILVLVLMLSSGTFSRRIHERRYEERSSASTQVNPPMKHIRVQPISLIGLPSMRSLPFILNNIMKEKKDRRPESVTQKRNVDLEETHKILRNFTPIDVPSFVPMKGLEQNPHE